MNGMPLPLDEELVRDIRALFRQPDSAFAVFGVGPAAFSKEWQKSSLDDATPVDQRLRMYELELRGQLHLLASQTTELGGADLDRIEAEGLALLIAIRELHRHFPELRY